MERARDAAPELVLTDAAVATVVDVVRRLDGLPLAIETFRQLSAEVAITAHVRDGDTAAPDVQTLST